MCFQSVVQSYLEGVGWGLRLLQESRVELGDASRALQKAVSESDHNAEVVCSMETLRELSCSHCQLLATVSNLPRLYSGEWSSRRRPSSRGETVLRQEVRPSAVRRCATVLVALTHHADCRWSAEKAVVPIWSWLIQHVQSEERKPRRA